MLHILYKSVLYLCIIGLLCQPKVDAADSSGSRELTAIFSTGIDTPLISKLINQGYSFRKKNSDSALIMVKQALWESRKSSFTLGIVQALIALSFIYDDREEYINSLRSSRHAIQLCKGRYERFAPLLYSQMGSNYLNMNNYSEAAINYYKAIESAQKNKHANFQLVPTYMNLYELWKKIGNKEKSDFYLNEAEQHAIHNDSSYLPEIYVTKALYHERDREKAKKLLLVAQDISRKKNLMDEVRFNKTVNVLMAHYYISKKDIKNAGIYMERLHATFLKIPPSIEGEVRYLLKMGFMKRVLKRYPEAEADILRAVRLVKKLNSPYLEGEAYKYASDLYADLKDFDKAYQYQVLSETMKATVLSEEKAKEIMFQEQKHQLMQKEMELAQQKLETLSVEKQTFQQKASIFFILLFTTGLFAFFIVYRKNVKQKIRLRQKDLENLEREKGTSLLQSVIQSEEEERKRIAMELHDGISSMLSVVKLNLNTIGRKYAMAQNEHFEEAIRLLDTTVEDVRNTSHSLLPDILLHEGLTKALHLYCKRNYKKTTLTFQDYGDPLPLPPDKEKHIFRIIQLIIETLVYHQIGRSYLLQLNWHENALFITIDIKGEAFLPEQNNQLNHVWQQVTVRTESIGGHIEYTSPAPGITAINIDFDL